MSKLKEGFDPIPFLAYGLLALWAGSFVFSFVVSCIKGTPL